MPHRIPPPRHPHEVVLCGMTAVAGAFFLFAEGPASLTDRLPPWIIEVWAATLMICGGLVVVGFMLRDRVAGVLLERAGLMGLTPAVAAYAVAVLALSGGGAAIAAAWGLGIAVASILRVRQINAWRAFMLALPPAHAPAPPPVAG